MRSVVSLALTLAALAASSAVPAAAQDLAAVEGTTLTTVNSLTPATAVTTVQLTGLPAATSIVSLDNPQSSPHILYGLGTDNNVYAINPVNGRTVAVTTAPIALTGRGTIASDSTGTVHIVTTSGQNLSFAPTTPGAVNANTKLAYVAGDPAAGAAPTIVGLAFNKTTAGVANNGARAIDVARGTLVQAPALANGQLATIGALGVPTTQNASLTVRRVAAFNAPAQAVGDIAASLTSAAGVTSIYSVTGTGAVANGAALPGGGTYAAVAYIAPTYQSFGAGGNTAIIGSVLDQITLTPAATRLLASVDAQTTAAGQNNQLLALSPAAYQNLTQLTLQSIHVQDVTVRRYLRDVRQGGTEAGAQAVTFGTDRHYALWLTGNGRYGFLKEGADRYRTSYGAYQFSGGVDYRFARGTLLGLYGGYDEAQARLNPLSPQSDAKTWFAGGYGSGTVGPVYIDFQGTYGKTQFDTRRTVADGFGSAFTYSGADGSEPRSEQYQGSATAGISQDFHGAEVEPYVGAKYAHVRLRSFSEGAAAGALSLNALDTDSLESIAGLRIGFKLPLTGTAVLRPSIRGEYRHEFDNAGRNRSLVGTFADGAGNAFPIAFRTNAFDQDYAAVGAGFTISGNSPFSIVVDYNGQIGREVSVHGVTGGFHLAF